MGHFLEICLAFGAGQLVGVFFLLFFMGAFKKPDGIIGDENEQPDNVVMFRTVTK